MTDTNDVDNTTTVLFVLALVYSAIVILMYVRTWKYMIKCGTEDQPLTYNDKIFKVFYGFIWFTVTCTCLLYWVTSME